MKHLKTFNESIKDLLTPKPKEDILKDLNKLSQQEKNNALSIASGAGYNEEVKYLIDAGADIHFHNDQPLRWASMNNQTEVVKILLDAGADVHNENDNALRLASFWGHTDVVKILIDYGADPKALYKNSP